MKTKVLVIGAGPSGSMAALRLAGGGFHDFIIVDRSDFPRGKPCAGGIAPSSLRFLQKIGMEHLVHDLMPSSEMRRVRFIGPGGQDIEMTTNLRAMTINRRIFDDALLGEVRKTGAHFIPGFTARELTRDARGRITGAVDTRTGQRIESEVTVMATGGRSVNFREKYFSDRRPLRVIYSRIGWWRGFDHEEKTMEMVFDRRLLPHYGWVFPEGDGVVNIGICLHGDRLRGSNVASLFDEFLDAHYARRLAGAVEIGRRQSFVINTSNTVRNVYANRMLCVGEAGRLCNPATAEGISYAMESGALAAEAIREAYARGKGAPDEKSLKQYEVMCRRAFNLRLRRAALFSGLIDSPLFNSLIRLSGLRISQKIISRFFEDQ